MNSKARSELINQYAYLEHGLDIFYPYLEELSWKETESMENIQFHTGLSSTKRYKEIEKNESALEAACDGLAQFREAMKTLQE